MNKVSCMLFYVGLYHIYFQSAFDIFARMLSLIINVFFPNMYNSLNNNLFFTDIGDIFAYKTVTTRLRWPLPC